MNPNTSVRATQPTEAPSRAQIDASCRPVVLLWYASATFWLVVGSVFAVLASWKMHAPYFMSQKAWLTFGRIRPAHLNAMIFGWSSMAGIGTLLWLQARLSRVLLPFREALFLFAIYWNIAVALGLLGILNGQSTGVEWLELPFYPAAALGSAYVLLFITSLRMLTRRNVEHLYVSQWYLFGSSLWFPFLYIAAMILIFVVPAPGSVKATANWWFAHNVLGLWLTPIGVATAYYLIPKILGRPVHSYYLSILGFWTLALFYNWVGTHHLIGGPLPIWLITVGTVSSLMMFVPVVTVAINHHLTMVGHFSKLKRSPTLRFVVFGAMSYTLVSVQGSLTALRSVNRVTHFTHYTIAHAHLGVYGFYTMIMFGAFYYILPRLTGREWFSAAWIKIHFWSTAIGITLYFVALSIGGIGQGMRQNDADVLWRDIIAYVRPFLQARSIAGVLMSIGHFAFALLVYQMLRGRGRQIGGPTLLGPSLFSRPWFRAPKHRGSA